MKFKNVLKSMFYCAFCFLILIGCSKDDSTQVTEKIELRGTDIFKGLFFLEANFVELVPVIENSAVYQTLLEFPKVHKNINEIGDLAIKNINETDPEFFDKFEELMKSDNQYSIMEAIDFGSSKIQEAFHNIFDINKLGKDELTLILQNENIHDLINETGEVDKERLKTLIEKYNDTDFALKSSYSQGTNISLVVTLVAVALVAVLAAAVVAVAGAINGGQIINLAQFVNVYQAVNATSSINMENDGGPQEEPDGPGDQKYTGNLLTEILIDQLAEIAY